MPKVPKERLDLLLTQQELCATRTLAQKLIRAGKVKVNQRVMDKPGTLIKIDAEIEVQAKPPFVSRGGEKLVKALDEFSIDVENRVCLDGGISTGGFTDCLFKKGAKHVYGVDVGYGQVAWEIRQDDRLTLLERTNFRHVTIEQLYGEKTPADLGVMDLSFISLTKVLPKLWELLVPPRDIVLLVKPQFEVGKEKVGKKGVVRDSNLHAEAIDQVLTSAQKLGWYYQNLTYSPITGPAGNIEYLLWLNQNAKEPQIDLTQIKTLTASAGKKLKT